MFLLVVWVFVFFPLQTPVTLATMNWNVLIFGSVMIFAVVYYLFIGKNTYSAPVELVKRNL